MGKKAERQKNRNRASKEAARIRRRATKKTKREQHEAHKRAKFGATGRAAPLIVSHVPPEPRREPTVPLHEHEQGAERRWF